MRIHRLVATQVLPVPLSEAWRFFSDPANLELMTPASLGLRPLTRTPQRMHPGMIVTYRISPLPALRLSWVTEISTVVEGELFVDEQRAGPYRFWHHQHHFRAVAGGTEVRDVVHYALPFGPLGDLFGHRLVRRQLRTIFRYRRAILEQRFGHMPSSDCPAGLSS